MFLGHFCPMGIKSGCHTQLYMGPLHHAKFQKKLMSQFQENLRADPILQDPSG